VIEWQEKHRFVETAEDSRMRMSAQYASQQTSQQAGKDW